MKRAARFVPRAELSGDSDFGRCRAFSTCTAVAKFGGCLENEEGEGAWRIWVGKGICTCHFFDVFDVMFARCLKAVFVKGVRVKIMGLK